MKLRVMFNILAISLTWAPISLAQTRLFPSGSGRPTDADLISNRTPHPRTLNGIDLDVVWGRMQSNVTYLRVTGEISTSEASFLKDEQINKTSPKYLELKKEILSRFLNAYESDVNASAGKSTVRMELIEGVLKDAGVSEADAGKLSTHRMVVQDLKPKVASVHSPSGNALVKAMRATAEHMKTRPSAKFGALTAAVDPFALLYIASRDQGIEDDIQNRVCRQDPSNLYVAHVMVQEPAVQKEILEESCHPAERHRKDNLYYVVNQSREEARKRFSTGSAKCSYDENGQGKIETISSRGTKQVLHFGANQRIEKLVVLSQDPRFSQSYLEYSGFPDKTQVRYSGIRSTKNDGNSPDFTSAQFENEPLSSFAARIHCTTESSCRNAPDSEWRHIQVRDGQASDGKTFVSPEKPFGIIQENADFFVKAAKTLGDFRQGIEQITNPLFKHTFQDVCLSFGQVAPKAPESSGLSSQPQLKIITSDPKTTK